MKKGFLFTVISLTLVMVALVIGACVQGETTTQTVTQTETSTVTSTIETTVTQTVTATLAPGGNPPETPHSLELDYGHCFSCHIIPLGHEGRHTVEHECAGCHVEAPQSEWTYGEGAPGAD